MSYLDRNVRVLRNYKKAILEQIVKLRTFLIYSMYKDKKERDMLKTQLTAVTPTGLFNVKCGEQGRGIPHIVIQYLSKCDEDNCGSVYSNALQHQYENKIGPFYFYFKTSTSIRAP